ncbi:MAG TPA: MurR/RpiR family transcriptional regulator [Casimicrobiaceae bacterium]|nr:MurR/RpiR family transcriptional regulator [Casimicrobiaceae bacterium]
MQPTPVPALVERFTALPPRLQAAARVVADHPEQVAVRSMREMARRAGVAPATMVRLAQALGFDDYASFRAVFIGSIAGAAGSYGRKAEALQAKAAAPRGLRPALEEAQVAAVHSGAANPDAALHAFVDALIAAQNVRFVAMRASHAIAFHFAYVYGLLRDNGRLLEERGGVLRDDVERLSGDDALVAVSLAPYTRTTLDVAALAHERGIAVLAITDSVVAPIASLARHVLLCRAGGPSFFNTMVGPLALVETVLATLAVRGGAPVVARLRRTDAMLRDAGAYLDASWNDRVAADAPRRGASGPAR